MTATLLQPADTGFDDEIGAIVREAIWAFLATAGSRQPHVRVIHPIWEGRTLWMVTGRHAPKARQIELNSRVELFYWIKDGRHLTITGRGRLEDDPAEKARLWELFKVSPVGFDPGMFWKGVDDPAYGLLRLDPERIEAFNAFEVGQNIPKRIWQV